MGIPMMNEKETQYVQSLEEENAKLRQELKILKSRMFYDPTPNEIGISVTVFPVYPPNSNPPFNDK
jgi:hypothetical protein